jgi:hypothetical protein
MIEILAIITCFILASLAVFQIALILGAPISKYAWGGQHAVLPANLKIGSVISILLYASFALIILSKTHVTNIPDNDSLVNVATWILAGYFWLGVIMNGISRSKPERNLMTPVALALALLTTIIALG